MSLSVWPVKSKREEKSFDIFEAIIAGIKDNKLSLNDGDVIVISSKYISNSQGRIIDENRVKARKKGLNLSKKFQLKPSVAELIIRESDVVFGGITGFVITAKDNIMAPNAGIDKSNARKGKIILYPNNPYEIAEQIKRKIFLNFSIHVGVIIADSRLMPSRVGTTGVALACAGIEPLDDLRSEKDLDGNPLKVTIKAVADNLASVANHKMGEGSESKPFAIIKNSNSKLTDRRINPKEMTVSPDQCVYVRGLSKSYEN